MIQKIFFLAVFFPILFNMNTNADDDKYLKAFPAAKDGMVRYVIKLPNKERGVDNDFKVELFVGKKMITDGVNQTFVGGKVEAKPLKGWGFTFYQLDKFGQSGSTRMGVPPGTPKVEKFVAAPSMMIPYNSRVPIVVYVPKDGEVRYRIWKAGKTETANKE